MTSVFGWLVGPSSPLAVYSPRTLPTALLVEYAALLLLLLPLGGRRGRISGGETKNAKRKPGCGLRGEKGKVEAKVQCGGKKEVKVKVKVKVRPNLKVRIGK